MTASAQAPAVPPRKPAQRPTLFRKLAGFYLDLLFSSFLAWMVCTAAGHREGWSTLALAIYLCEIFWCRNFLKPTLGSYFVGIQYLTSTSNQVVADIQVVNPKARLNSFLVGAGSVEMTLAVLFLAGWTLVPRAVFLGATLEGPAMLAYWLSYGFLFFFSGAHVLSASQRSLWFIPLSRALVTADFLRSLPLWVKQALPERGLAAVPGFPSDPMGVWGFLLSIFFVWSLVLVGILFLSRKSLTN